MTRANLLILFKIFFGVLGLCAITTEISILRSLGEFVPPHFFSQFSIEANLFAGVIIILSSLTLIQRKKIKNVEMLRGMATLNLAITGIVFVVFLSGTVGDELTKFPWDNLVLHYILPMAVLLDWYIDAPKREIHFKQGLIWLIFPITYFCYTLFRGYLSNWYPYPFLDPRIGGYLEVTTIGLTILALSLGIIWLLTRSTRK